MDPRAEIRAFLRARRAAIAPEQVGFGPRGSRRRVKGLRREEVAQLAGISVEYYALLERGRLPNASDTVIAALAEALRLDQSDRHYLWTLARGSWPPAPVIASSLRQYAAVADQLTAIPAFVMDHRQDMLAMNDVATVLFAPVMPAPPLPFNLAREACLGAAAREFFGDWEETVRHMASMLRTDTAHVPGDPECLAVAEDLRAASPEFRAAWDLFEVGYPPLRELTFRHPEAGPLTVEVVLAATQTPGASLVFHLPAPGSEAAIARLAVIAAAATATRGAPSPADPRAPSSPLPSKVEG
jgi:transcriptional regulator with XRE-family HTH domain